MDIVKNVIGSGDEAPQCGCDSWIDHWCKNTGRNKGPCAARGCQNSADVGAHVVHCNSQNGKEYIVPLCHAHNQEEECFMVLRPLVPVGTLSSC